ncbi:MAG: PaaI family thioesterase [Actinobacteria bacterium]|nr:PaaI family thioesterase [Actinomycetota bacterium]
MADEAATEFLRSAMPLCGVLDMTAEKNAPDEIVLSMEWRDELCTGGGLLHGGAIMALADSAGGACAFANLPEGATGTATIESKTNFLGAVRSGTVTATAKPLHKGSMTIVVETEVSDDTGKLVAKVTQTQAVLGKT